MKTNTIALVTIVGLSIAGATAAGALTNRTIGGLENGFENAGVTKVHKPGRRGERGPRGARGMRAILRQADTNNDRAVSQEEVDAFIAERVSSGDADGDGNLTLEEFQLIWNDLSRQPRVRAFQRLDTNGDAVVSQAELDERFGSIVAEFDRNDDGVLSRDDRRGRGRDR